MFGLFKSKHRRATERAANELTEAFAKVAHAMNVQRDMLTFFDGKKHEDFLTDPYFVRYAFGMFDAATTILGLHLRQKLGRGLIERWFVPYIATEIELPEPVVRGLLEKLFERYANSAQRDAAMTEGGFDGMSILQGGDARKLLDHYGFDSDAPISPREMQAFGAFVDRDRFAKPK
jgi:hypothetical protein